MTGARNERGFTLAALIIFLTAASVMLAVGVPAYQMQRQREMEEELIFRAQEYVRAILKYQRQNGIYPPDLDALSDTNGIRYLRREYTDPFTGAPFRLLTVNGDGTIEGSTIYDNLMDGGGMFQGMDGQAFGESSSNMPSASIGTTAVLAFPSMQSVPGAGGGGGDEGQGGNGGGGGGNGPGFGGGGGAFDTALDLSFNTAQGDFGGGFGGNSGGGGRGFGGGTAGQNANFGGAITGGGGGFDGSAGFGGGAAGQNANFGGAITGGAGFGSNFGGAFGGNANFGQSITPGGGGFGGGANDGGFGDGNGAGTLGPPGADTSGGISFSGGVSGIGGSFLSIQQGTANQQGRESGSGNDGFQPNFGAGGIVGVAPDLEGPSLKVYNERERYEEWEFIAIPGYGTVPAPVQRVEDDGLGDGQMQMFPGN